MPSTLFYKTVFLLFVIVPLLATIFAIWLLWERAVDWSDLTLLATLYLLVGLGETVGFHRMLTHRSFQARPAVKFVLLVLGTMSIEGPPIAWAAVHIKHHAHSDRDGDPHSPLDGLFHAHLGWIFGDNEADPDTYCPHLFKDRLVMFVDRTTVLWGVLSLLIPLAIGGWTGLLWGGLVRIFLIHHITWSVNSICHTFGKREFQTNDRSRNQWLVGLLGLGEGWHNNHHAFPHSAFHGLHWWQIDLSGYVIWTLERLGLIYGVYRVPFALRNRSSLRQAASGLPSKYPQ